MKFKLLLFKIHKNLIIFSVSFLFQYECKVQNLKKRKVAIQISVDGVKVSLKKKKRKVSIQFTSVFVPFSVFHVFSFSSDFPV